MEMSMAKADTTLTPTDLRQWLNQEVRDVMKAAELRIKDATDFVTLYATGKSHLPKQCEGSSSMTIDAGTDFRCHDRREHDKTRKF